MLCDIFLQYANTSSLLLFWNVYILTTCTLPYNPWCRWTSDMTVTPLMGNCMTMYWKRERFVFQNPSARILKLCYFLLLKAVTFIKIRILVLIASFKNGAKTHTSGCGHFDGISCQLYISNSTIATRGKQNWCT
jgi:hypothetical protein